MTPQQLAAWLESPAGKRMFFEAFLYAPANINGELVVQVFLQGDDRGSIPYSISFGDQTINVVAVTATERTTQIERHTERRWRRVLRHLWRF